MSEQSKGNKVGETQSLETQDINSVHHKLQSTHVHSEFTLSTENTNSPNKCSAPLQSGEGWSQSIALFDEKRCI